MNVHNIVVTSVLEPRFANRFIPAADLDKTIEKLKVKGTQTQLYHCLADFSADGLKPNDRRSDLPPEIMVKPARGLIYFDFDGQKDNAHVAIDQAKTFARELESLKVDYAAFFSGNRGIHITVHSSRAGLDKLMPEIEFIKKMRSLAESLKSDQRFTSLDAGIYTKGHLIRAYGSYHTKGERYKIQIHPFGGISLKWYDWSVEQIIEQAKWRQTAPEYIPQPGPLTPWLAPPMEEIKPLPKGAIKAAVKADGLPTKDEAQNKLCIAHMRQMPDDGSVNMHDVRLRIICDDLLTRKPKKESLESITDWCKRIYPDNQDKLGETISQFYKIWDGKKFYQFSCSDEIKAKYCSDACEVKISRDKRSKTAALLEFLVDKNRDAFIYKKDIFFYNGQYWATGVAENYDGLFVNQLLEFTQKQSPLNAINTCTRAFAQVLKNRATEIGEKIYQPKAETFNFSDGTYNLIKQRCGLSVVRKDFSKDDYLTSTRGYPLYGPHGLPVSSERLFDRFIELKEKHLGPDTLKTLQHMLGLALFPARPMMFFLVGEPSSGKSMFAKLAYHLIEPKGEGNLVSAYQPTTDRFAHEPGINKIANIVTELNRSKTIDFNTLKQIRDGLLISVERKNKPSPMVRLPLLHIYCCNLLPKNNEGNTGALDGRIVVIRFRREARPDDDLFNNKRLVDHIIEEDLGSVMDWARDGFAQLLRNDFEVHVTKDSQEQLRLWSESTDIVNQFLEDVADNQDLRLGKVIANSITGAEFHERFVEYVKATTGQKPINRNSFFDSIDNKLGHKFKIEPYIDAHNKKHYRLKSHT